MQRTWRRIALTLVAFAAMLAPAVLMPPAASAARPGPTAWQDELNAFDSSRWFRADGWTNGAPFNVGWRANHVSFSGGIMTLTLDKAGCPSGCSGMPYASGEYRTTRTHGYGRFEVSMKAAAGPGVVSSFFTYTGPGERPPKPWDEIDVEILGKDPTKLQTNFFTAGVGGHEVVIDLGFDASAAFHTYAFVWAPDRIVWYVDGAAVRTVLASQHALPVNPGKIMMNLWTGYGVDEWLGVINYTAPVKAYYDWVKYTPR